jgi:hypothetical protein
VPTNANARSSTPNARSPPSLHNIEAIQRARLDEVLDDSVLDPLHQAMRRQLDLAHEIER